MAGDVVGTAFVKIRALTDQLAKDIKDDFEKGKLGSDLDKAAKSKGEDMGEELGDGLADEAEKTLKKRAKNIVPEDDITDGFKNTFKGVRDEFRQLDLFDDVAEQFDQLDLFEDHHFDIVPDFNSKDADNDSRGFFSRIRSGFKDIGDTLDDDSLGKSLDDLSKQFKNLGKDGGASVGLLGKSFLLIGGAVTAALPFIQDIGAAILAYVVGLTAQVGFLTTAVAGAGVAAGAALGAVAISILPIFLAFKSETKLLTDFKDGMKASVEEFMRIGTATQATLLPALDKALEKLTELVPMFSEFGLFVGQAVGGFAKLAAGVLTGNEAQGRFQKILQASLRILDVLFPTLINVGNILSGIWVAALPAAERLVGMISKLVGKWKDMVVEGLKTGELTDTFDLWFDRAALLGSALSNVAGAIFDILQVGANSSDNVFQRFDEWAQRFRNFTESESGKNRLALIFDNALEVMHEINGIAADLFDGIFGRLGEVGGVDTMVEALKEFRDFIPTIQEAWEKLRVAIKDVVGQVASNVWGKLKKTWEVLEEPLGRLVHSLLDFFEAMNKSGSFKTFLKLMQILTDVLSTLLAIPGFGTFVGYLVAFGGATKIATIALSPFLRVFGQFSSLMINFIRLKIGGELSKSAGGMAALIRGFQNANALKAGAATTTTAMQSVKAGGAAGAGGATSMAGALGGLLAALGPLAIPLATTAFVAGGIGAAFLINKHRTQEWDQEVRQATADIGLLSDGLNITATGIANYIRESSRFDTHNQIGDIAELGLSVEGLSDQIANGEISYQKFAQTAVEAGEVTIGVFGRGGIDKNLDKHITSVEQLQKTYALTEEQLDKLSTTGTVWARAEKDAGDITAERVRLTLEGNTSVLESYKELAHVIGESAKDSVDAFVSNDTNLRLLGEKALDDLKKNTKDIDTDKDPGKAIKLVADAQAQLAQAAVEDTAAIKGLNKATVEQINAQVTLADGSIDVIKQNELMRAALEKQNTEIRENLALFQSIDFATYFGGAKDAVINFNTSLATMQALGAHLDISGGLDEMLTSLGPVKDATFNLFNQLKNLPEAQFNAAAAALGTDADVLREAMEGAEQAINDLAETALSKLPSVGELLDKATSTDDKTGEQFFNKDTFIKSVKERTQDTKEFGENIANIQKNAGDEAARLAAQQGPEAAKNLAKMAGTDPDQLAKTLKGMEDAEAALTLKIKTVLGPGIASQYAIQAQLIGGHFGDGLAKGLNSEETIIAIQDSSDEALTEISKSFQGYFQWDHGVLVFVYTGKGKKKPRGVRSGARNVDKFSGLSDGGFVGGTSFGNPFAGGPFGTDTVPTWLTPGEFVLRRSIAQAIPANILTALNAGDPRLMALLSATGARPGVPLPSAAPATPTPAAKPGGNFVIQQMNIEAPTPEDASHQVISRLRILHSQLS